MVSRLVNRNVFAGNGRSSMRLEPEIWAALEEICRREKAPLAELVQQAEGEQSEGGRTSAVRTFAFKYFRDAATEAGHRAVGHGALESQAVADPVGAV